MLKINQKQFLAQFVPLKVCVVMPATGGDWSYLIWIENPDDHSWWAWWAS